VCAQPWRWRWPRRRRRRRTCERSNSVSRNCKA
jgi:hypothetical protein